MYGINNINYSIKQQPAFGKVNPSTKQAQKILQSFDEISIVKRFRSIDFEKEDQMREMTLKMKKWLRNLPKRIERRVVNSFFDPNAEEIFPKKDNCHDLK